MQVPFVDLSAQYHSIKNDIDKAIAKVIEETAFISGKYATAFEKEFAQFCGNAHVIACANGTDSLEILMQAMGIGRGDEVIVPAISWISTSEAVSAVGAIPVFVDVDEFFLINVDLIEEKITPKTKAIIPVHLYGQPADMPEIMQIAKKHHLKVIEDCAQSHGSAINGKLAGTFGDAASYSFYPGKNLGAYGDAGAMATNDEALAQKTRMIANHGQLKKHEHIIEGRNSRMDGLQAAILSTKLPHLNHWTDKRIENAAYYSEVLNSEMIEIPLLKPGYKHVYHLFVIQSAERDLLMQHLESQGIGVAIHYPCPLPFLACYKDRAYKTEDFPMADHFSKTILSIPMYPELSKAQMDYVAEAIHSFFSYH